MSLTNERCSYCKGSGKAERFEECVGGQWRPLPASVFADLAPWHRRDAMNQLAVNAPTIVRWNDCACPQCDGVGSYMVEHVACKVF